MSRLGDFFLGKVELVNPPPGFRFHVSGSMRVRVSTGEQVMRLGLYPEEYEIDSLGIVRTKKGRIVRDFFPEIDFVMSEANTDRQIAKLRQRVLDLLGEESRRDERKAAAIKRVEG